MLTPRETALVVLVGCAVVLTGVALLGGLPWALMVGGVAIVAVGVLAYDPKTQEQRLARRRARTATGKRR